MNDKIKIGKLSDGSGVTFNKKIFLENILERDKELKRYFGCEEFNDLIGIIMQYDSIIQEYLKYGTQKIDGLSADRFGKVCDTIFHNLESEVKKIKGKFPEYRVNYEGLQFTLLIGQGSTYFTHKLE